MSHLQQQYKNPRQGFGDTDHGRFLRAYKREKSRRETRIQDFDKNRKLQDISVPTSPQCVENIPTITDERAKKLLRWKEERNRKKRLEDVKKKPAFKVGIVHHSFYSPVTKCNTISVTTVKSSNQMKHSNDTKKRVTRATEKRLLAKATKAAAQKATVAKNAVSVSLTKPLDINRSTMKISDIKMIKSFAPNSHKFKPPSGLSMLPLFGAVAIEQTPSEKGDFFQNKPIELKTQDTNDKEDILKKLETQNLDCNADTATTLKNSVNSRLLSNKQELNESTCNSSTAVSELKKKKSSLSEHNIQESFEREKSLPNNINMETPTQKTFVTDKSSSSEKENCSEDLITFSPYLTLSRGKKNARKEQMLRLGIGHSPSNEIPTKDTVMKNLNISVEEEERTAQYFKFLLNKETDRLKELCTKWLNIRLEKDVPEDAMYEITQAVGQTNLLIDKKFDRFRRLVSDCETGMGQMLVTCKDLQGFWDMTCMEVKDCDFRFKKLEERRKREWQEEEEQLIIIKPSMKKQMTTKKQIVPSKPSSLRSLILAARRKKMAETSSVEDTLLQNTSTNKDHLMSSPSIKKSIAFKEYANKTPRCNTRKSKSIDNGFKSTPAKRNSFRGSLTKLEKVQFSDTFKRIKSPLAVMKISKMCKTPEVQLDDTISYINSNQTPGKSILKKSEEVINKEIRIKSTHKVIFDDQIALTEVSDDEETRNKRSLAAAMNRIDSLDLDDLSPTECINAGKRLEFETEDFDNSNNQDLEFLLSEVPKQLKEKENTSKLSVCNISDSNVDPLNDIISAISFKEISPKDNIKTKSPRRSLRCQSRRKNTINNDVEVSVINNLSTTSLQTNFETSNISETTIDTENIEPEPNLEIRALRNRIITTNDTPKINKTNKMMTPKKESGNKKENESPVKSSRKKSLKLSQTDRNNCTQPDKDDIKVNKNTYKKRRSSRKSVAFDVEACIENKPVLPMTPHLKRGTPSRQSRSKNTFDEDMISQQTLKSLNRVTRSHTKN
ncbi:disks large-associated protein 5-like [Odontomachus brunneus]|uniref:disks large-associated protein 5-like n=1 Tax=Odontomachus brunneus TaxID=486640 RepID=UPI0013F28928|nr:disks large-associated protein 5-like [Odontomachus brunneus]